LYLASKEAEKVGHTVSTMYEMNPDCKHIDNIAVHQKYILDRKRNHIPIDKRRIGVAHLYRVRSTEVQQPLRLLQ
jgi:hypothetical protein